VAGGPGARTAPPRWAVPLVHGLYRGALVLAVAIGLAVSVLAWTGRVRVAAAGPPAAGATRTTGTVPAADYRRDGDRQVASLVSVRFDPARGTRVAHEIAALVGRAAPLSGRAVDDAARESAVIEDLLRRALESPTSPR